MGKLVIVAGPSGVGKSPLYRALRRFHPELTADMRGLVLFNDRAPRPGEEDGVDYHFRSTDEIRSLQDKEDHVVMEVRGDLQALNRAEVHDLLTQGHVLFEGNPFVGEQLLLLDVPKISVFVAPLSGGEIEAFSAPELRIDLSAMVTDIMRRKLLRRTRKQKGELSQKDLSEIERRAGSAYDELRLAWKFQHVIPNHDGEDSENWDAFYYPIGDARRTLTALVAALREEESPLLERWGEDLLE
jgi:guanylate kinase